MPMKYIFVFTVLFFSISVTTALKCHKCVSYDYVPSNIVDKLNSLNISLDDLDTVNLAGNCKSKDNYCSNGTWCAKRQSTYNINISGVQYKYNTVYKTCVNQTVDTNTQPENGKCYDTKNTTTLADGITKTAKWCYCNNKDYCNSSVREFLSYGLLSLLIIVHLF